MLLLCSIFCFHFIGDFLFQSREMGKQKSKSLKVLFMHLFLVFTTIFFGLMNFCPFGVSLQKVFLFSFFNIIVHGIIDWNIWRLYKKRVHYRFPFATKEQLLAFKYYDDPWFYRTIGFDQLLHTVTIIILWGAL